MAYFVKVPSNASEVTHLSPGTTWLFVPSPI